MKLIWNLVSFVPSSEEAVLEVKRAAVAEVQRAVAVAVAESRANERMRVHRLLDLPLSQRNHSSLRQGPFLRVHGNSVETSARNVTTPTTTPNSAPSTTEDEKDVHLTSMMGSVSDRYNYIHLCITQRYHGYNIWIFGARE